jgi:hypothetical protein
MKYLKTYEQLESDRFLEAAKDGNLDELKELINQGIDVNIQNDLNIKNDVGYTALISASNGGLFL